MDAEERQRSGSSGKTSKKGGKQVKALTAEEEARRREVVKEKLREKLELERRALNIVERLLEDSVAEDFLLDCARFIAPANYKDTIEERSIAKMCGYPICPNKLGKIPTQQFKISTKTNKVYDITERKCFCSNFCYKASKEFELQISTTPLWLRQHESPREIKLMKRGDGGSSGEEVKLSERRLQDEDVENPLAAQPDDAPGPQQRSGSAASLSHSEDSDAEQEQDFVSSVVSQRQGPRVHWGDLPKHTDEDTKGGRGKMERRDRREEEFDDQRKLGQEGNQLEEFSCKTETEEQRHPLITDKPDEQSVEEATAKLNLLNLSETVTHTDPPPADSTQAENTHPLTPPPGENLTSSAESRTSPTPINRNQDSADTGPTLSITQVGMSRRGAAGLRDLLKNHADGDKPDSIRLNLLECLRRTLKDWSTEETLRFLYGADHSLVSPFADVEEEKDEELDEDDLEDEDGEGVGVEEQKSPSAAAPDYQTLQQETQQLELRVREFYKGTWVLPEGEEELPRNKVTEENQRLKDPALPLVDSQAQQLIQKRITVEKLTSCLRNIVGPLSLNMSDVSTDLNNLVRTFRFTNTNIIHKTPQWTLLSVVLLHLLSEVSPVVRGSLQTAASAQYLNTLMEELGLEEQDLKDVVRLFKTPTHMD